MSKSDRNQASGQAEQAGRTRIAMVGEESEGSEESVPPASADDGNAAETEQWGLPPLTQCWFLTGPTASGKTPLALELARRLDAEIISLDSMAIYQGMDIGTAKPTRQQRAEVPHHLLDIVPPTTDFSVANYVTAAHRVAAEIHQRGKRVLVCGGTPLYLKSLLRGMFLGPPADWGFRHAVEEDLKRHGGEALRQRLEQVDPLLTHKLHPNDHRRMIRALEVARLTGKPLSHWQLQFEEPVRGADNPAVVLRLDRGWLHRRINARVDAMFDSGLETEVRDLLERFQHLSRTASQAVGYREMLEFLRGEQSFDVTREAVKAHTRQFARRQEIWFRSLSELQRIEMTPDSPTERLIDQLQAILQRTPRFPPARENPPSNAE